MKFLDKYNQYKKEFLICEGSLSSIQNIIQQEILSDYFGRITFKELTKEQQDFVITELQKKSRDIESKINYLTNNKQYQSWLYDQIKEGNVSIVYFKCINNFEWKAMFDNFSKLCKSPKLTSEQKNIQNYNFNSFRQFIADNKELLIKNMNVDFKKVYSNNSYDIYSIGIEDKDQFQQLYGPSGYNCGWCIINKDKNMFEHYLKPLNKDCYYLWTIKGTMKPFALFHFKSGQFKDIHNAIIRKEQNENNKDLLDGLFYLFSQYRSRNFKNELWYYKDLFLKFKQTLDQ